MAVEHFRVQVDDRWVDVSIEKKGDKLIVRSGSSIWQADLRQVGETSLISLLLDNQSVDLLVYKDHDQYTILRDTEYYQVRVKPIWASLAGPASDGPAQGGEVTIESPLMGVVTEVRAEQGKRVEQGDVLVVIEAMKMQNELRAPRPATVRAVRVRPGQKVSPRQPLVVLE